MYKGQHESLTKFRADISNALLFGRISASTNFTAFNNAFTGTSNLYTGGTLVGTPASFADGESASPLPWLADGESNPVQTTMGLDQYAALYGINDTTAVSSISGTTLANMTRGLNKFRAPLEYMLFLGTEANIKIEDLLNATGAGTSGALNVTNRILQGDPKNIDLGIDSFRLYGRTYRKKYLPILDHPLIVNTTGSTHNYQNAIYGIPMGKQKTVDNQMLDRVMVRYMANDGTDLKYREVLLGGLAPVPTSERSVLEIHYQSTQGLQVLGANHLVRIKA
jgi:hypothetical protein